MIRKEDCEFSTTWDSNYDERIIHLWNQTIVTKINIISNQIFKVTCYSANKIIAHPSKRQIFQTLEYYNIQNQRLCGKYKVIFDYDCDVDIIYVYNNDIENLNFVYTKFKWDENGVLSICALTDPLDIQEQKKKHCGYIKIIGIKDIKFGR